MTSSKVAVPSSDTPVLADAEPHDADTAWLRPPTELGERGLLIFIAIVAPVYAVTLAIARPADVSSVIVSFAITVVASALVLNHVGSVALSLESDGVRLRRLPFPPRFTPSAAVAQTVLLKLYEGDSLDTVDQLFLIDASGRTLLRVRGKFWTFEQLTRVAHHFDAPLVRLDDPVTLAELRATRRAQIAWHERHPVLMVIAAVTIGTSICFAAIAPLMAAFQ